MGYRKRTHTHNPYRSHKPVKDSLLEATRKHVFVHMTNEEILARDKVWDKQYPSKNRQWTDEEREAIETLGKNISKVEMSDKLKQSQTKVDTNADIDTGGVLTKGNNKARDIINELERVFGDENKVRETGRLLRKSDSKSDGNIRVPSKSVRADEDGRVGRLIF